MSSMFGWKEVKLKKTDSAFVISNRKKVMLKRYWHGLERTIVERHTEPEAKKRTERLLGGEAKE